MKNLTIRVVQVSTFYWTIHVKTDDGTVDITTTARSDKEAIDTAHGLLWYYLEKRGTYHEAGSD